MKKYITVMLIILIFITGCTSTRIIDRVQIIQVLGYDLHGNKLKGTVIYPTFEEQGKNMFHLLGTEANSFDNIFINLNSKSSYPIDTGQLRAMLFNENFAKQGLNQVILFISKDPVLGSRLQLAVTEPNTEQIMKMSIKEKIPTHIYDKINQNIKYGGLPKMNMHIFLTDYYQEGIDPYLPYITSEGGKVKINGVAMFKKSKFVGHINLQKAYLLKLLKHESSVGRYQALIESNKKADFIFIRNLHSTVKYTINQTNEVPEIAIDLTMKVQIKRVPESIDLTKTADITRTEELLEDHFNNQIEQLISLFQQYEVDPIGLGEMIKANSRNWDYDHYLKYYPYLKTTVNTKVRVIQTGIER